MKKNHKNTLLLLTMRICMLSAMFLVVFCDVAFAAPNLINYQGVLTDSSGTPVTNVSQPMTFRLFDAATSGTKLWEEVRTVDVQNGSYSLLLGSVTPFPADLFQNDNLWLEVVVGSEVLGQRQRLASAPYAIQAGRLAPGVMSCLPDVFVNCYSGPAGTRGVGLCKSGTRECGADGLFAACQGEVLPATESCDGQDDDCNGLVDDAPGSPTYYADSDGDGFGDPTAGRLACTQPTGFVVDNSDCDDAEATSYPGAPELCNGKDSNCDGSVDVGCSVPPACTSTEVSLITTCTDNACIQNLVDTNQLTSRCLNAWGSFSFCLQNNCTIPVTQGCITTYCQTEYDIVYTGGPPECSFGETRPCGSSVGACQTGINSCDNGLWSTTCQGEIAPITEICGNGIDDDCNGVVDDPSTWYLDNDSDGYGNDLKTQSSCQQPVGYVASGGDCNDTNPAISPQATEICDGIDNDCDGGIDNVPGEGTSCGVGACSGGVMLCGGTGSLVCETMPGGPSDASSAEVCDGIDNDCDGQTDENAVDATIYYQDSDNDGYGNPAVTQPLCGPVTGFTATVAGDCNDSNFQVNPGSTEVCTNALDDDCDGLPDCLDSDCTGNAACSMPLVVNEVDYDQPGATNTGDFIEIINASATPTDLTGYTVDLINGTDGSTYASFTLTDAATSLPPGGYLVVGTATVVAALPTGVPFIVAADGFIQNGSPDGVDLQGPAGIDSLVYEGTIAGHGEGTPAANVDDGTGNDSLGHCPDGTDTDNNNVDFWLLTPPTPGAANSCP